MLKNKSQLRKMIKLRQGIKAVFEFTNQEEHNHDDLKKELNKILKKSFK